MLFNINISMEYYISRYTLAKLENSIQNYKRRILMDFYKIPGTIRISFSVYNTKQEVDLFLVALKKAIDILS